LRHEWVQTHLYLQPKLPQASNDRDCKALQLLEETPGKRPKFAHASEATNFEEKQATEYNFFYNLETFYFA